MSSANLEAALRYFKYGWNVIPLKPKSKEPVFNWKEYQTKKITETEIRKFWTERPDANIGLVCGQTSGVFALDIDGDKGKESIKGKELPPTVCQSTGRGVHYLYKVNGTESGCRIGILPGVDIKGSGGYIVIDPSVHPSGSKYQWYPGMGPFDHPFSACPSWLSELISKESERVKNDPDWHLPLMSGVEEGGRDDALTKLCGKYIAQGLSKPETFAMVRGINLSYKPPLPEDQVIKICESVYSLHEKNHPKKSDVSDIEQLKNEFKKWLHIEEDYMLEIPLSVIIANQFKDIPVWLFIIAPPSSGKTEILMSLSKLPHVYFLSRFTEKTFISGMKKKEGMRHPSLIVRLKEDKKSMVVMKDFTTFMQMRSDQKSAIMSQLREIYDGNYFGTFGNSEEITWSGHLGIIAGVTNRFDIEAQSMTDMGERFINFRPNYIDQNAAADKAIENIGQDKDLKEFLSEHLKTFFANLLIPKLSEISISKSQIAYIKKLAEFVSILRCAVARDTYWKNVLARPSPEGTPRLIHQFMKLVKARSVLYGRTVIDDSDLKMIARIAKDSIYPLRFDLLENVSSEYYETTRTISERARMEIRSVKEALEDLMYLGVIDRSIQTKPAEHDDDSNIHKDTRPYTWILKKVWAEKLLELEIM